jgi:hypothetical protein
MAITYFANVLYYNEIKFEIVQTYNDIILKLQKDFYYDIWIICVIVTNELSIKDLNTNLNQNFFGYIDLFWKSINNVAW